MPDTNEQRDPVKEGRELLNAPNAYTLRAQVRELIKTLCDEVDRLREQAAEDEQAFNELYNLWKKAVGAR